MGLALPSMKEMCVQTTDAITEPPTTSSPVRTRRRIVLASDMPFMTGQHGGFWFPNR
jgi:hypothetical protein